MTHLFEEYKKKEGPQVQDQHTQITGFSQYLAALSAHSSPGIFSTLFIFFAPLIYDHMN